MRQRLQKILSNSGFCSRKKAEELVMAGVVSVNGTTAKIGDCADPEKDQITIGNKVVEPEKKIYLMVHKPKGYVCTLSEKEGKRVVDLLPFQERLYTAGRLDRDASGLVIVTNDGEFANRIMHPNNKIEKKYFIRLESVFNKADRETIRRGVRLDDCIVRGQVFQESSKIVYLTITQGQNKVVKRLFSRLGYYILDLVRVQVGPLNLDIKSGRWRNLKYFEIEGLKKSDSSPHKKAPPQEMRQPVNFSKKNSIKDRD